MDADAGVTSFLGRGIGAGVDFEGKGTGAAVAVAFAGVDGRCEASAEGISLGAAIDVAPEEGPAVGAMPSTDVAGATVTLVADAVLAGAVGATLTGVDDETDDKAEPRDEATLSVESNGTSFVSTSFNVRISNPDDCPAVRIAGIFSLSD